jgi:single-strand DNA-binding protein
MNSVNLIGRLVRDPEIRFLSSGTAVANFTLAIDKQVSKEKKQEMESKGEATADFINIVVWGKMGENSANYLAKGRLVGVTGRLQSGKYEKDGRTVYTTDVIANQVEFLEWGDKKENKEPAQDFKPIDTNEDIPF